jgi:hypothetical protein
VAVRDQLFRYSLVAHGYETDTITGADRLFFAE